MQKLALLAACAAVLAAWRPGGNAADKKRRQSGRHGRMMQGLDANNDGQITQAEAEAARAAHFTRMDADGDGFITQADRDLRRQQRAEARAERREARAERGMRGDADGDGRVSRAEFLSGQNGWFERADANSNGVVEASEIEAARNAMRERRAARHSAPQTQSQ
jgi:hypothetical protein